MKLVKSSLGRARKVMYNIIKSDSTKYTYNKRLYHRPLQAGAPTISYLRYRGGRKGVLPSALFFLTCTKGHWTYPAFLHFLLMITILAIYLCVFSAPVVWEGFSDILAIVSERSTPVILQLKIIPRMRLHYYMHCL